MPVDVEKKSPKWIKKISNRDGEAHQKQGETN